MSRTTYKYPKSHWDPRILDYVGLKQTEPYYKNYIYKCLLTKLEGSYRYGRYELDDDLIEIFRNENTIPSHFLHFYKYVSKNSLNYALSKLRRNGNDIKSEVFTISFDQNGENLEDLEL